MTAAGICMHTLWEYHKPERNYKRCACGLISVMTTQECWRNREQWTPSENDTQNSIRAN